MRASGRKYGGGRESEEDEVPIRSFMAPFPSTKNSILYRFYQTRQLWGPAHYDELKGFSHIASSESRTR